MDTPSPGPTVNKCLIADKALHHAQTILPSLEGTLCQMGYSGTYFIQVGFHETMFRYNGKPLEEIILTLHLPLNESDDVIRKTLAVVFHPFSARIRVLKGREIYICAWVQDVVPPKFFDL